MNWTGKASVFVVAVLALALTGLCAEARAEVQPLRAGDESAFFYPSFPNEGGPYIIAASFWNGPGTADSLIVVFSEPIDETELEIEDFVFHGFEASTLARLDDATMKYAVLTGFTGTVSASVDSIGLVWNSVKAADRPSPLGGTITGSWSKDIGMVPLMTGPAIIDVVFEQHYDTATIEDPYAGHDYYIDVVFSHPITLTAPTGTVFKTTPELAPILLTNTVSDNVVTIRRNASSTDSLNWPHPGIAKLWLEANRVYWTALGSGVTNSRAQKVVLQNFGPVLMAAYYNDMNTVTIADDQVWLVYDQPLPAESLGQPAGQYFPGWDTSGFASAAEQGRHPSGAFYSNVVVITNPVTNEGPATPSDPDDQWIIEDSGVGDLQFDYQFVEGARRLVRCRPGVGITRAAYFDRGDDNPANDQLHIWFSEMIDIPDVTAEDFVLVPYIPNWQSQVVFTRENINGVGHVVISGWNNVTALAGSRLPNGHFVRLAADDAFDGLSSQSGCDGESLIPIFDDSEPARIRLNEVVTLTYKRYNPVSEADTVFLAWRETGTVDDSDQYFLFFTNQDGTDLDDIFIGNYRHNALAAGNLTPVTVDAQAQRIALDITRFGLSGIVTTDGHEIQHGDRLRFMLVPATYWGVFADGDGPAVLKFTTTIVAGPVCPPQDWDENDDDIIHVEATYAPYGDPLVDSWTRRIYGDANAAPCGTWVYIFDRCWEIEPGDAVELGRGPINANKSFDAITLDDSVVDPDTLAVLYVYAWEDGAWSTCLPILNDIVSPTLALNLDGQIEFADRFNPYQIYKADDYVNILLKAFDHYAEGDSALSGLLSITADFSFLDNRTALPAALGGHPVNAVPLVSLGADEIDNDGDWVAHDPTIDLNDDGVMDFPEPFVDENGNGIFDPGETFFDRNGNGLCDCPGGSGTDYDLNLDSADPDEHGFYEVQLLALADAARYNDVIKGFQLLDPVTDPDGQTNFGEIKDLPVLFSLTDTYLDAETAYDEDEAPFLCEVDEVPPTVSKVTELYQRDAYTGTGGSANLVIPTDPVYNIGRFFNFKSYTPSDDDVLFSTVEIKRSDSATWLSLTLDPPGWNTGPGVPGVAGHDDDGDRADGVDANEDGVFDELDGIDLSDAEVVDAMQDSLADANAVAGDGIYRTTDRRDNDNDAFFIFEPYFDVDGGLGSSLVTQKVVWFNIDESTTNDIDDNNDGIPDNASEVETYDPQSDDNEDGISDGEAVELLADGARHYCVFDPDYVGPFYVDAAHVLGQHAGDLHNDIRALTEFVPFGYGVLDANGAILTNGLLPGLPWGDDSVADEFEWYALKGHNVDWWHLAQIYFDEIPDGTQQYDLRVVAYDQAGNVNPNYAVPFSFTSDVTPPEVWLTDCPEDGWPVDFGDGVICNSGSFTLTIENPVDAVEVVFERRISTDEGATWGVWELVGNDVSLPFTAEWNAAEIAIPDVPPDYYALVEFRAYARDEFGNWQDADEACVAQVRVQDCQAPWTWFTMIHETMNTHLVGDHMNVGDMPNPYYYRDVIGPLQVPRGPAIDIWALFSPGEGLASTYDHDVIRVVFEISLAGTGVWTPFATVTGHVDPDDSTIDLTIPVAVTLETEALATGTYDIRVYSCDLEGNNCEPADEAPIVQYDIAKITIVEEGLRAYIEPVRVDCDEEGQAPNTLDLYAINWIHDYFIDKVLFQYSADGVVWHDIAVDDGNSADPRGDIVLRRGFALLDTLWGRVAFRTEEKFIDYDGDGYSERDPIIWDDDADGVFDPYHGDDDVILGDLTEILEKGLFELTAFPADEFHTGEGDFDPSQWIFRENQSPIEPVQMVGDLNLWHVQWDITGLAQGEYLVRAVATDIMYAVDEGDIPTVTVSLDAIAPAAVVTTVTTPDGTEWAAVNDLYFDATVDWVKVCATSDDVDISQVIVQFRIPGHPVFGDWHDLDVNDDQDFYADIDGIPGLSAEDEIFLDVGSVPYVWDPGDIPIYLGANGVLDAANMAVPPRLIPNMAFYTATGDTIFEEDGVWPFDDDNDGMNNEDLFNPRLWFPPYCVYFPLRNLGLISDSNIEFRAIATDQSCNVDADPAVVRFMFAETVTPETDVVWVKRADGTFIDVLPLLSDGTDVTQLGAADIAAPVTVMVTGEDATAITRVDLLYRPVGECVGLSEWMNPWRSMSDDGYTTARTNYDYPFTVDLAALAADHGTGVYEFFPQAKDNEGNLTPPPVNPYRFKIMLNEATITTAGGTVAPGDEYWFAAELAAPADALVHFLYAERILEVAVDASRIVPHPERATFWTLPLELAMVDPAASAILTLNGAPGTYFPTAVELIAAGGAGDWTYDAGTKTLEFAVRPEATDEILVSYNLTDYDYLWDDGLGVVSTDGVAPYTAAWDAAMGHNVPFPVFPQADAYDVIAVVEIGAGECGLAEAAMSEGLLLLLEDELAPNAYLYGGGERYLPPPHTQHWPGNPSFGSVAGLIEWKLSGVEHEFFATSDSADVETMELVLIGGDTDTETVLPMDLYTTQSFVPMTFTLYQTDFPEVPYAWENVTLNLNGFTYAMLETVAGNGIWQVGNVPVPVGAETPYAFTIDMVGNDFMTVHDPRNFGVLAPPGPMGNGPGLPLLSRVSVPPTPFWHVSAPSFGETTSVWQVRARATDFDGNVGSGQLYTFVYDPVPPAIEEVTAERLRFASAVPVTVTAIVTDPVPPSFDVITVKEILVQYCPNYAAPEADRVWLHFGHDDDPSDGWAVSGTIPAPATDGFDNDGNGEWDEAEESTSLMAWRVFAVDDGHNYSEPVVLPFTLDDTPPVVLLTAPVNGEVYPFGSAFDVTADVTESEDDVAYVQFWFAADIDEYGDPIWERVDITPEDDSDHPFDTTAPYAVEFLTTHYLDEMDTYVRFKAEARDGAGNSGWSEEALIVVNDITGPTAFPMWAKTSGSPDWIPLSDPHLAVTGHNAMIMGTAVDPSGRENLAWVRVQYEAPNADSWTDIGIIPSTEFVLAGYNAMTVGWSIGWDVVALPEGVYQIRAIAADIDGNYDESPIVGSLRIDHTAPEVLYELADSHYHGFPSYLGGHQEPVLYYAAYENDGLAGSSLAIKPDQETGDLAFTILTRDADISAIRLEMHQDGTHELGEWIAPEGGDFDFEPNLTFAQGGQTYYVWWLRLDNAADVLDDIGLSGRVEVRALATDYAGNRNILKNEKNDWKTWTLDIDDPTALAFHHDLTADQVASGDPVDLQVVMTDGTTDVVLVRFEYSEDGADWTVIDPDPATPEIDDIPLTAENIDTPFARWTADVTWTTPYPLVRDIAYHVRAIFYDTVGREGESEHLMITVEDNIKPEFTKIWAIPAMVRWIDDTYMGSAQDGYEADCEWQGEHDALYIDMNANGIFDGGDIALDAGTSMPGYVALWDGAAHGNNMIGSANNTWPRYIDEIVLGGTLEKRVAREVTLVARTQIADTGLERVEFWAEDGEGQRILVGTDECPPAYEMGLYFWHVIWNTRATNAQGNWIYPDGEYTIVPIAYDLEGNVEEWGRDLSGAAVVTVDNTAPAATASVEPTTVERNDILSLRAETDVLGLEDDAVFFMFKRATDLNMAEAWIEVDYNWGVDASDVNPDYTRPYVFDWNLNKMDVPFPLEDPIVGLTYHMAASSWDILGNTEAAVDAFAAGRYATFTVVDTRAPAATITEIARATGDTRALSMPHLMGTIHARDLSYLTAKILGFENDTEKVEFMWAQAGDTTPMLIDAQVQKDPNDPYTWHIHDWDLSPLAGQTIQVFAVGTDDVGNSDYNPTTGRPIVAPFFTLFVDYAMPVVNVRTPFDDMKACRVDPENRYYDLVFGSSDADIDIETVSWQYKLSALENDPENWVDCVLSAPGIVWDVNSQIFAGAWDIIGEGEETLVPSDLYDVRLTVHDVAGNAYAAVVAERVVIDVDAPWGQITRVEVEGESFYPTLPIDITAGMTIDLWATAHDVEEGLALHTGVAKIIFQVEGPYVNDEPEETWRDIGFWQAPTDEQPHEEVSTSVTWNTSGEPEGSYYVRILVEDEECNGYESGQVTLVISDQVPPRARIAGFDPWQIPHGDDRTTYCDIYAAAYSDDHIAEVQFQYSTNGTTWIPFGITRDIEPDVDPEHSDWLDEMCDLWYATIDLRTFTVGQQVWFRAVAKDEVPNQDPNPPVVLVEVVLYEDGSLDLAPVSELADLADLNLILEGGSDPDDIVIRVDMGRADQRPYVLYLPPTPVGQGGQPWCVEMHRMIDGPFSKVWQGAAEWVWDDCGKSTIFAGALSDDLEIDLHVKHMWNWPVTYVLGSNGTARVPGYPNMDTEAMDHLYATATVPSASGAGDYDGCLLLSPSLVPELSPDDVRYLQMIPRTGYAMGWLEDENHETDPAYPWTLSIDYDEAGVRAALAKSLDIPEDQVTEAQIAEIEPYLTVRAYNWYDDSDFGALGWTGKDISFVDVDPEENRVTFKVSKWCYYRPHFALFVPKWNAPVVVRSFTPWSPYAGRWNYTDVDPKILIDLNGTGVEPIDPYTIEIYIDGHQVASWMPEGEWAEGNGDIDVQKKNFEGTRYQVYYQHSTNRAWWLTEGWHTLNVMYKQLNGPADWVSLPSNAPGARFYVDNTAPYIAFHGGWVDNPRLSNVAGYINPITMQQRHEDMLTVYLYDAGAGILVRPEHLFPLFGSEGGDNGWHEDIIEDDGCIGDPGIKYDLWLVHDEDDQAEIDEIEERLLLHSGTADEIIPYITPPLFAETGSYTPDDTMVVRLPIMAGGRTHNIQDGDILEVTLYTKKHIEHMEDYTAGCVASLVVNFDPDTGLADTLATIALDCYYDRATGLHVYDRGIYDWAGNSGSKYVEQRFIVDMSAPTARLVSPSKGWVEPGKDFDFEIMVEDEGAGLASVSAKLLGPDGMEIADGVTITIDGGKISGRVIGGLAPGTYHAVVDVTDKAGNADRVVVPILVEAATLALSNAYVTPNPSNPTLMESMIHFTLSRRADMTIKIYDFAGEYVSTVSSRQHFSQAGTFSVPWAGVASDGTPLANGAYLIRLEAHDGSAIKTATVKAVIWKE